MYSGNLVRMTFEAVETPIRVEDFSEVQLPNEHRVVIVHPFAQ
jgi:hypothetical protein